jgi:hypothetical protein
MGQEQTVQWVAAWGLVETQDRGGTDKAEEVVVVEQTQELQQVGAWE